MKRTVGFLLLIGLVFFITTSQFTLSAQTPITATVKTNYTVVWSGPGPSYAIVTRLMANTVVTLTGKALISGSYWYQVLTPQSQVGWIWGNGLNLPPDAQTVPDVVPPQPATATRTPTRTATPTASGSETSTPTRTPTRTMVPFTFTPTNTPLPPTDTPIPPTETPLPPTETPIPPTDTPAEQGPLTATVITNFTVVWSGPSPSYDDLFTLTAGTTVTLTGKAFVSGSYWYQVLTPQSQVGWIWGNALNLPPNALNVPDVAPPPTPTPVPPTETPIG
ncbi:MAG: SH3 domain-containing protein [Anaerolineae bacterium]